MDPKVIRILRRLKDNGWVPLKAMGTLLGYSTPNYIYERQRQRNKIPMIQVGKTHRIYEDVVLDELGKHKDQINSIWVLGLYKTIQLEKQS